MYLKIIAFLLLFTKAHAFYSENSPIVNLNSNNFNKLVRDSKEIWLVEFFAPWCGHCQSFASEYEKAAKALDGIIKVGAVNADENSPLTKAYNVQGYPTVKIFNAEKGTIKEYQGQRKASALVNFMVDIIQKKVGARLTTTETVNFAVFKSKSVKELSDRNFDELVLAADESWLVVFYSPFCEQCKQLAQQWSQVENSVKDYFKLGAIDATFHSSRAKEFKITEYPTILFFPKGKKKISSAIEYSGKLTDIDIAEWSMEKLIQTSPSVDIIEITSFESLTSACEHKPLCVLSFLPHILECDTNCRNEYLNTIRNVSQIYKKWLWGWVWSEAHSQPNIEDILEIGGGGYPTMAAVSINKMRYSILVGSFSFDGINEFLRNVAYGRGNTRELTVKAMPEIFTINSWNGKDVEDEEMKTTTELTTILDDIQELLEEASPPTSEVFKDEL